MDSVWINKMLEIKETKNKLGATVYEFYYGNEKIEQLYVNKNTDRFILPNKEPLVYGSALSEIRFSDLINPTS